MYYSLSEVLFIFLLINNIINIYIYTYVYIYIYIDMIIDDEVIFKFFQQQALHVRIVASIRSFLQKKENVPR